MSALRKMRFEEQLPEGRLIYLPERRRQELARDRQIEEVRALVAAPVVATVSSASTNDVTATSLSVTKPASTAQNDLLLYVVAGPVSTTVTAVTGTGAAWTSIGTINAGNLGTASGYKICNGTEPASYSFTYVAGQIFSVAILRITGASTTQAFVFDVLGTATGTAANTVTAVAIANKRANDLVIGIFTSHIATAGGGSITSGWAGQVFVTGNVSGNAAVELISKNAAVDTNVTTGSCTQSWTGFNGSGHTRLVSFSPDQANGAGASTMASYTASGSGSEVFAATGASTMASIAASGSGAETFSASGAAAMSPLAAAGVASEVFAANGASTMTPFTASGVAALVFVAAGTAAMSGLASSGTGTETFTASGAAFMSSIVAAGSIGQAISGSGASTMASFTAFGGAFDFWSASSVTSVVLQTRLTSILKQTPWVTTSLTPTKLTSGPKGSS